MEEDGRVGEEDERDLVTMRGMKGEDKREEVRMEYEVTIRGMTGGCEG